MSWHLLVGVHAPWLEPGALGELFVKTWGQGRGQGISLHSGLFKWPCAPGHSDTWTSLEAECIAPVSPAPRLSLCSRGECGPRPLTLTRFRPGLQAWEAPGFYQLCGGFVSFSYLHFNKKSLIRKQQTKIAL